MFETHLSIQPRGRFVNVTFFPKFSLICQIPLQYVEFGVLSMTTSKIVMRHVFFPIFNLKFQHDVWNAYIQILLSLRCVMVTCAVQSEYRNPSHPPPPVCPNNCSSVGANTTAARDVQSFRSSARSHASASPTSWTECRTAVSTLAAALASRRRLTAPRPRPRSRESTAAA